MRELADGRKPLAEADRSTLRALFVNEIYDPKVFFAAMEKLEPIVDLLPAVLPRFRELEAAWGFKVHSSYLVVLTLYGPGGSYDPDRGIITMLTTADGSFKGGGGAHTIVHEMVHLGIEHDIVKKHELTHWEKERLVDLICMQRFGDLLVGYELQSQGTGDLDGFVTEESLADLPKAIAAYIEAHPREKNSPK